MTEVVKQPHGLNVRLAGQRLWRPAPHAELARALVAARCTRPFLDWSLAGFDPHVARSFQYYQAAPQYEYCYRYRHRACIEPVHGYVVRGAATLVRESMPHSWERELPDWGAAAALRLCGPVIREHAVISLREFGDTNYYHFYNDVLGKLALLDELGIGQDMPIVISIDLARQPYFQSLMRLSELGQRRWIVQGTTLVAADEIVFCKPLPHVRRNFDYVLDRMALPPLVGERRVFLTRQRGRGRWIENSAAVAAACAEFGFEEVDADMLDLAQQIELFRATRLLVGIHGAGLTNCIFRRGGALDLLELFPPDSIPPHYFWLARNYGYGYRALVGERGAQPGSFRVDVAALRARLRNMLLAVH